MEHARTNYCQIRGHQYETKSQTITYVFTVLFQLSKYFFVTKLIIIEIIFLNRAQNKIEERKREVNKYTYK